MAEWNPKIPTNISMPLNLRKKLDELAKERDVDRSALSVSLLLRGLESERIEKSDQPVYQPV